MKNCRAFTLSYSFVLALLGASTFAMPGCNVYAGLRWKR